MLYLLYYSFVPNTATMNRALSFFRGLERLHVQATVVFMMPDTNKSKVKEDYRYVKVKYLWDKLYFPWTFFKYVSYYIYCYQFLKQLKPRDIVYIGSCGQRFGQGWVMY